MKKFEIFKAGKQTSSNGVTLEFTEDMLKASAEAYDPALYAAPLVVGHPKDNHPAYGQVASLSFSDGIMEASPSDVDPEFSELVKAKRYKNRSASFYLPDSPNNPKPGVLYLRHVGFLGAVPPAIKGLKDVQFSDAEEGVVEFSDTSPWIWSQLGGLFRGLREYFIAEKGIELADKMLPSYMIDELNGEAERQRAAQSQVDKNSGLIPSFTEPTKKPIEDTGMLTPEQIQAMQDENVRLKADAAKNADFAEAEKKLAEREAALLKKEIAGKVDELIAAGKVLPAHKDQVTDFMASLQDADTVVEFGEGDKAEKFSQRAFFEKFLSELPKAVDFSERSKDTDNADDFDVNKAQKNILDQVTNGGKASA